MKINGKLVCIYAWIICVTLRSWDDVDLPSMQHKSQDFCVFMAFIVI